MAETHSEIEARKAISKLKEYDNQTIRIDKGENPIGEKMDPKSVNPNIWKEEPKKKGKKGK